MSEIQTKATIDHIGRDIVEKKLKAEHMMI